jgi:hypothetical protein
MIKRLGVANLTLNPSPEAGLMSERGNCEVYETKNISSQIRHREMAGVTNLVTNPAQAASLPHIDREDIQCAEQF